MRANITINAMQRIAFYHFALASNDPPPTGGAAVCVQSENGSRLQPLPALLSFQPAPLDQNQPSGHADASNDGTQITQAECPCIEWHSMRTWRSWRKRASGFLGLTPLLTNLPFCDWHKSTFLMLASMYIYLPIAEIVDAYRHHHRSWRWCWIPHSKGFLAWMVQANYIGLLDDALKKVIDLSAILAFIPWKTSRSCCEGEQRPRPIRLWHLSWKI